MRNNREIFKLGTVEILHVLKTEKNMVTQVK